MYHLILLPIHLSCKLCVWDIGKTNCLSKVADVFYPACIWRSRCWWHHWNFIKVFSIRKLDSVSCHVARDLPVYAPTTFSHSVNSPFSPSITPYLFHSRLKTYLFHKSFPPYSSGFRTDSTDFMIGPFLVGISVFLVLVSSLFFFVWFRAAD